MYFDKLSINKYTVSSKKQRLTIIIYNIYSYNKITQYFKTCILNG